jgi:hypothetical protein
LLTIGDRIDPDCAGTLLAMGFYPRLGLWQTAQHAADLGILMVWCHSRCLRDVFKRFSILLMPVLLRFGCHLRHALVLWRFTHGSPTVAP